ncbi:DHA2 family efflux MFS transporter permease subunit [Alloscardovia theropitheci]|uniref:DHA2 family efflux MFS transporter permease subunit n=2 Tax=Alloscardovia theropitheci TaxID=2496842 RepID=A0A4R0R0K9_9BIFI|nr:DHA2 family efflux MFS transporter permease subunit [Alloscardovia theropitheci]
MALYIGAFTGMYSETAMNVILPTIGEEFGVSTSLTQWLVVGYMLMIGLVLPFSSILIKHFTVRTLTFSALGAFAVGAIISALAPNFAILLIGRAIQGIGLGLVLPMTFSMVLEIMPPHKLGAAMGMTSLIIMLAPVIGPTLAGILAGAFSWRFVFWSIVVLAVIGIIFAAQFLINAYELTKPKVDILSVILSIFGFGGVVLGAGMASEYGWMSVPVIAALIVGIAALVWYSIRQFSMTHPVLNLRAFGFRDFSLGVSLVMLNFGITLSVMFLLPQFFQNSMAFAVSISGMLLLPGGIINAVTSMLSGRAYNKIGVKAPALIGFAATIIGLCILIWQTFLVTSNAQANIAIVIIAHILMMIGVPLAMSPLQTYTLSTLPREMNADGSTIMNTLQQVVGAVFTALATSLLMSGQSAFGGDNAAARFGQGTRWGLYLALGIAILGFIGSLFTRDTRQQTAHEDTAEQAKNAEPILQSLMKTDVYALSSSATAMDAMALLTQRGISGAPIIDEKGNLTGFISDGDILSIVADRVPEFSSFYSAIIEHNSESFSDRVRDNMNRPVSEFATHSVITVDVNDSMSHICEVLVSNHLKKVPVVDKTNGGRMVGILNRSDVLKYVVENF